MVSFTSMPIPLAAIRISSSDFPVISNPVNSLMESVIDIRLYGALKSILCSPKVASVVPFTANAQCSNKRSVKFIIQL